MAGEDTYSSLQLNQKNWLAIYQALCIAISAAIASGQPTKTFTDVAELVGDGILNVCDRRSVPEKQDG